MLESLRDPEFRKQLIDEHINVGIAFQIRSLRDRQKLTQTELAELLGDKRKQPLISEWENPNYGKYTLGTLKDLAKAFDVGLLVRFVPFNTLVDWTMDLTSDIIAPPNFSEDNAAAAFRVTSYPMKDIVLDANQLNNLWSGQPIQVTGSSLYASTTNETEKVKEAALVA
jgi:transcriptional regulator with XRE-family HTH domain